MQLNITIVIIFAWLTIITLLLIYLIRIFRKLIKNTDEKDFVKVFKNVLKNQVILRKDIHTLDEELIKFQDYAKSNLNRFSLVRFNPFSETGGDNSFSLCILNDQKDGFVITGLHTRERTRLYVKPIKNLKSEYELSKEENDAIEKAYKKKA